MSGRGIQKQRDYYSGFHQKLQQVDREKLPAEEQADYDILQDQIALAQLDIDIIQSWRHNPTYYVELLGNALFAPYVLDYAPKEKRAGQIIARVQKIPRFLDQAKRNLSAAPPVWIQVAREENQGNIALIDTTMRAFMPEPQKDAYQRAADTALLELKEFDRFLTETLPDRKNSNETPDWRLGEDTYKLKFRFALETDLTPAQVLQSAENDLKRVRGEMFQIARNLGATGDESHAIREALDKIATNHSTVESYFSDAKADLAEARAFVQQKNLLTMPPGGNLETIETPEFMRGIYAVGGFNPAPALEPKLHAFYWITPIPSIWDKTRAESKLREYNFYNLKLLTIHEAMPGHYVQGEFANRMHPKSRRVLRGVFGNTPNVEGWAQYATQAMLDEGFLNGSPELKLTFLKQELRVIANAIIDIRMQSKRMSEQQALDLMEKQTFQEREEATAKIQRAQLSSAQLPAYLVGWRGLDKGAGAVQKLQRRVLQDARLSRRRVKRRRSAASGAGAATDGEGAELMRPHYNSEVEGNPEQRSSGIFAGIAWLRDLALSVVFAVVLIVFLYQPVKVEGTSMMPSLTNQERIFINKFTYKVGSGRIDRGDTVVFLFPEDKTKSYIKRVIGLPGDRIRIDEGQVYVNGEPLMEPYVPEDYRDRISKDERVVPRDDYFVMGDHRNSSNDSRAWGYVPRHLIYGKAVFVYWPIEKMGRVR